MSNTFTAEHRATLEKYLTTHELRSGLGNEESACSIAAINLAISGELTDDIPACMSEVLGKATIVLQDAMPDEMPDEMRNSMRYKRLLPDMAGTGRSQEKERCKVITEWMWEVVLPQIQPLADNLGLGSEWNCMCEEKSESAARAAAAAAAGYAADATHDAAYSAAAAARAGAAARAAADGAAADGAARAAAAAVFAASAAGYADVFWKKVDVIEVLERMTYLKGQDDE